MIDKALMQLEPKVVWENFLSLSKVPRASHNREIVSFLKEFGETNNLQTIIDDSGNVIIRKPASLGMGNKKIITLQVHSDMVASAKDNLKLDFKETQIRPFVENGWIKAKDTTLGADNGIGMAAAMAVLESKGLLHGPIEVLFTADEEVGMVGAKKLHNETLKGDILLNLDSDIEGILYTGSAGSIISNATFELKKVPVNPNHVALEIVVSGLQGGHSGLDIAVGRANANKIINRLLWFTSMEYGVQLSFIKGGNAPNAIPAEARAVIVVPKTKKAKIIKYTEEFRATIKQEFTHNEPDLHIMANSVVLPDFVLDTNLQNDFFRAVYGCPNGLVAMNTDNPEMVETSSNLGVIRMKESEIQVVTLQRSIIESAMDDLVNMINSVFSLANAKVETIPVQPVWTPSAESELIRKLQAIYFNVFDEEPETKVVHAGLECGIIISKHKNIEAVSFGPTIENAHTINERANIESVERFWRFLVEILENVEDKPINKTVFS